MNQDAISKYNIALDMARSNPNLSQYVTQIRNTLGKLLTPSYIVSIDEIVWVECFIQGGGELMEERTKEVIRMQDFTEEDWRTYQGAESFKDGRPPMIGFISSEDNWELTVLLGNAGIEVILFDCEESLTYTCLIAFEGFRNAKECLCNEICKDFEDADTYTVTYIKSKLFQQYSVKLKVM